MCNFLSFTFIYYRLTTLLDVNRTLEYLAYFGYRYVMADHENQLSAMIGKKTNNSSLHSCLSFYVSP